MKLRKTLLVVASAILLVVASVMGTMAWLTSTTQEVKNTFTVGNVAISLDEAKVNEYGSEGSSAERVTGNTYKLINGHTYTKDPTIHVAEGSEDCYLFVKVVNGISGIEASGNTTIAAQMKAKGWKALDEVVDVYYYTVNDEITAVSASNDVPVFGSFTVADGATLGSYANASVTVTAYAVQKDGFEGKTANEIWTAAGFNS